MTPSIRLYHNIPKIIINSCFYIKKTSIQRIDNQYLCIKSLVTFKVYSTREPHRLRDVDTIIFNYSLLILICRSYTKKIVLSIEKENYLPQVSVFLFQDEAISASSSVRYFSSLANSRRAEKFDNDSHGILLSASF